jgi:hypothetical protein
VRDSNSIAIMEYVDGESLRILEQGRLPVHTAVNYAGQVLDALAYAPPKGRNPSGRDAGQHHHEEAEGWPSSWTSGWRGRRGSAPHDRTAWRWDRRGMSPEQVRALDELDGRTYLCDGR